MRISGKAIILLSGGLDSATVLYIARRRGYECHCLIFDYGQRHKREVRSAVSVAKKAGCAYRIMEFEFPWKGSALLDKESRLPERGLMEISKAGIPSTYVPARNIIFLSIAAGWAEAIGARSVFIGANARDYSGYPDCRGDFLDSFRDALKKGTKSGRESAGIKIETPLISMSKAAIVRKGISLRVPYELTWSCYRGGKHPCGMCDSCVLRAKGFKEAGQEDSLV